ncbi:MAG: lamin tail domain-containing protein, partial [Cytophagales bacterium]
MINKRLILGVLISLSFFSFSQVEDSFDAGSLNGNIWQGDLNFFQISNGMLKSNGNNATNQKIYLSTPNTLIDSTEWNFLIDLGFNPTSTTFVRAFLTSDQSNLTQPLNGYYIQYGETNQDFLRFGRQQGNTRTELFVGNQSFSGNIRVRLKITRDTEGNWEFFSDRTGGTNFISEGKVKDNQFKTTQYFGFLCEYATASRFNLYSFDDVLIRNIVKDTVRPTIQSINVLNNNNIQIKFSEAVEKLSAENPANYSLEGFTILSAIRSNQDSSVVTLTVDGTFENPKSYNISVRNIKDLAGNLIIENSIANFFNFTPFARSLIINELMPDPDPVVGLPNAEFIEIFNPNNFNINIGNWKLSKGTTDINIPNAIIEANSFIILCSTGNVSQFSSFGNTLGVPSIPALVNSGDRISLKSPSGLVVDEVNYRDTWYRDAQKRNGGWSLEQINPNSPCSGASNWIASVDPSGGTPGRVNSVFNLAPDTDPPVLISQTLRGKDSLLLVFSEPLDTASIRNLNNFSIENNSVKLVTMDSDFTRWWVVLNNTISEGQTNKIYIVGIKDCAGNTTNDFEISFGLGKRPERGEILITEIMADETPVVGLPEAEFVEI